MSRIVWNGTQVYDNWQECFKSAPCHTFECPCVHLLEYVNRVCVHVTLYILFYVVGKPSRTCTKEVMAEK